MTDSDTTFNAAYVDIVALTEHSITDILAELARDHRETGRLYTEQGDAMLAASFKHSGQAYEHAISLLELAWNQAMQRVAHLTEA